MKIISVNVGLPRSVRWKGRTVSTAIFKTPVFERITLRPLNLDGDRQADLTVHGGPNKAVYAYPADTTLIGAMSTRMRSHLEISRGHPNVHVHAFYSPPAGEEWVTLQSIIGRIDLSALKDLLPSKAYDYDGLRYSRPRSLGGLGRSRSYGGVRPAIARYRPGVIPVAR